MAHLGECEAKERHKETACPRGDLRDKGPYVPCWGMHLYKHVVWLG